MADEPYALVVTGEGVLEQKLGTCGEEALLILILLPLLLLLL